MALLWCDGFEHYGLDETNLLDGPYGTASAVTLNETYASNGARSIRLDSSGVSSNSGGLRKVLPTAKTKMGAIGRFYFPDFPVDNNECVLFDFLTSYVARAQVTVICDANGRLSFYRGARTEPNDAGMGQETLLGTTDPILTTAAWNHIEVQVNIDDTVGWIRVAVNGVHRYELTNIDTAYNTEGIISVRTCRYEVGNQSGDFYLDDLQLYDFVGDSAVDTDWVPTTNGAGVATNYIGELQCVYLPPNGDTIVADWTPSTGTDDYAMVDELDPNDLDYLYAVAAADLTELDLTDLPPEITYIRGLQLLGRLSKTDSGAAMVTFGMNSNGVVEDAPERPVTVEPTYWWDFMNTDPDSGARWTRTSLNAAKFRINRTV